MNILKRFYNIFKRILKKEELPNLLEAPKLETCNYNSEEQKNRFITSLKSIPERKKNEIETCICGGDGLGIHKKCSY